ncbi:putative ribonuclease H-like domain-containing protein [Tanacetum coccineum]
MHIGYPNLQIFTFGSLVMSKTPYELLIGRTPIISFMRPFGCPVTILNTLDHLGKFDGKANKGFLVGYSINSKAFRVFNSRTRKVEENLHVNFLENKPNVAGSGPEWLFDIDILTNFMNYQPEYILLPLLHTSYNVPSNSEKDESSPKDDAGKMNEVSNSEKDGNMNGPREAINTDRTNRLNTVIILIILNINTVIYHLLTTRIPRRAKEQRNVYESLFDLLIPDLEDIADLQDTGIFGSAYDDEYVGIEADLNNLETNMSMEPKKVTHASDDESWVEAMQEELLQFKLLNVWTLVDLPNGKKIIGTKWVFRNKRDQRGIVVRNKARLVAQGHRQEEGINYDEVFAPVARIEAIRLFLAFASFMGFTVYQMDVKSAFLYGTIEEEVYVNQPLGFVDPEFPTRVYKVEKALYGLHQAPRAWSKMDSLMYLTSSRPDIILLVACSNLGLTKSFSYASVRNLDIIKVNHFGLCIPKDSPMDLIAYSDSDYAGASIDRKSTTREYIATSNCRRQVLWLQNQLLDYGYNFMKTHIHVDNESAICVVKNPVYHSKTKHIEIRHHFIRDSYEKKLIEMVGDEAVHKELGDRMEKAATTASSFEAEQDSDAQTRFEAASKSTKIHFSQEVTHLEVGRTVCNKWN